MLRYLARRAAGALVLVVVVSSGALLVVSLAPGDFASELFGSAPADAIARERARYGLDRPVAAQYLAWASRVARLDFGESLLYRRPVGELVARGAANTGLLALVALAAATLAGIPAGIVTGSRRRGLLPSAIRGASLVLLSLPSLVTSLALVLLAARTQWFPTGGMTSAGAYDAGALARLLDVARHLPVPALAIALPLAAMLERMQSQATSEAVAMPFASAALARGVPRGRVVWRDALRPSLGPTIGVYGFVLGSLLSGSFVVEVVTSWPGLGRLMYDALRARDLYLVAGCAAAGAAFLAAGTFLSDAALAWADPRTRPEAARGAGR